METYLKLFEQVIREQAEHMGADTAYAQAKRAGLGVSRDGRIVSCTGNPQLVLLRLLKSFTETGSMAALTACAPLLNHFVESIAAEAEESADTETVEGERVKW